MAAAGQRLGVHRLTDVRRQRDGDERRALAHLHDWRPEPYLQWALGEQRVAVVESPADARGAALREWSAAVEQHGIRDAVLIARDNATRGALNSGARGQRRDGGHLGDELQYGAVTVAVGDRVICRRNDQRVDVDNGTRGTVRHVDPARVMLEADAGTVRELPADYVAEHLEHAYALTGHGMQGGTVEWAGVVAEPRDLTRGWSYTALSRARATTRLHIHSGHVDRPEDLAERGPDPPFDRSTALKKLAATPALFGERRQPTTRYLCVPRHSSETRRYVPMVFAEPDVIAHDSTLTIASADEYLFGLVHSAMWMAWVGAIGGRIKSDYRVSAELVYNTFPWPDSPMAPARERVEDGSRAVLIARDAHPDATLADLYDPRAMPADLVRAHAELDRAVDALYGRGSFDEIKRLARLLERYQVLAGTLSPPSSRSRRQRVQHRV